MVTKIKPYNPSASDFESDWHVLDASGKVLGRLASEAATMLMGKHRPGYVPHMLSGDFVIITNATKVRVTGNKAEQIVYKRHSQKPGKLKEIPFRRVQAKFPTRVIEHAVRGMLPRNKLGERMIRRLKVYAGEEHPHVSQLSWTASRPERDAVAAEKAAEEAKKRAEIRQRSLARRDIAASAAAKSATPKIDAGDEVAEIKAAPVTEPVAEKVAAKAPAAAKRNAAKKPPARRPAAKTAAARKPAAKRAATSKASTARPSGATATRKKPAASKATSNSAGSSAKKATGTRKSSATSKKDAK